MPDEKLRPRVLSVTEAARAIGISRSSIYKMQAQGEIGFAKLLGRTVVPCSEVNRVLAQIEAEAKAQRGAA